MSDLLSFILSNSDKHEFSSIWKWISCCNDVMNHVDCVINRDVYPQKKCPWYIKKNIYIMGDIAWIIAWLKDKIYYPKIET